MRPTFTLVWWAFGGQGKKSQTFSVQANDLIFASGSTSGGGTVFTLSGISAQLLITRGIQINQTRIWRALEAGQATVTQSGSGSNWDHIVAVVRPSYTPEGGWKVLGTYTDYPPNRPKYQGPVVEGDILFIHRYAGTGANVKDPPVITGINYQTLVDGLPEGGSDAGNARETVIKVLSSGQITIEGPTTTWMQVNYVHPAGLPIFDEFFLV